MRPKWAWTVFSLFLVNEWLYCCNGCLEQERIALLQIKAWINHPDGNALADWVDNKENATDCCNWSKVECNTTTRRVITLFLGSTKKSWSSVYFNASLFTGFTELQSLNLSHNNLHSCFENQGIGVLSSRLGNLEVLDLSYNNFNDSILSRSRGFSSLRSLNLAHNGLTGSLHINDLNSFTSLEELNLSHNQELKNIVGPEGLSKLKVLQLDYNKIRGSILLQTLGALPSVKTLSLINTIFGRTVMDQEFYNLTSIEELFLDGSDLPTNFFEKIGALSTLKVLSLSACQLSGTLPVQGLCELKNLEELYLFRNALGGLLPSCLGNLSSLRAFDVSNNHFVGNIASSPLTNLTSLEYLAISNNQFQVPISFNSFLNHSKLKLISCDNNKLISEPSFQTSAPKFQLQFLSISNCLPEHNMTFPNFLHNQHDLRVVDLSHNNLIGTFPSWLFANNTRLNRIHLRDNSFGGSFLLPQYPCSNLSRIDISNNKGMLGQIPRNICSTFPQLEFLRMANNGLTGSIPPCFGNISSLQGLDLSNNQLSGGGLEFLTSLTFVKLSNNNLDGEISSSIFNSSTGEHLYLDGNNFRGQIFSFPFTNSSRLMGLVISSNHFSGMLPRWIGNTSHLLVLDFSKNHFEGPIPEEFCQLDYLFFFELSENNLTGSIPSCFNPRYISHVHLYKNQLSGPLTYAFYNSSSMVTLDLRKNNFSGSLPNWIGRLSPLSILLLKDNHFEGVIPAELCLLRELSILDLSQNEFSGHLPSCLGNSAFEATDMKTFVVFFSWGSYSSIREIYLESMGRANQAERTLDSFETTTFNQDQKISIDNIVEFTTKRNSYLYKGDILNFMTGIDLSCNRLTGEIPSDIGKLSKMHALNLSHNNLTGSIPATFSNLKQIESMDLSYNNLNDRIPPQLTKLNSLAVFSVAYNNLSGKTPEMIAQFATFDESSYEGNPLLCGPPLQNCSKLEFPVPQPPDDSHDEEEDGGYVDMGVFYVSFGVCYLFVLLAIATILYINPYWRRTWFQFIEGCITTCYYFALDSFSKLSSFKC